MRILVLGAGGMAGHVVATYLEERGHEVSAVSATHTDRSRTPRCSMSPTGSHSTSYLQRGTFDVVVNCIGLLVKASEEHQDRAVYLNAYLPHQLEHFYERSQTKVVHLGTDCVFSGTNAPYTEGSLYDGQLVYDRSKALGEIKNDKDLTLRMSIIGPDTQAAGVGLFNWFYAQTGPVAGYTRAIWSGITTIELAKGIDAAIAQDLTGLYHLVPATNTSKFDLLQLMATTFGRDDITVEPSRWPFC